MTSQIKSTHSTHFTRFSDASTFDEICINCGATDATGIGKLTEPCSSEPWQALRHSFRVQDMSGNNENANNGIWLEGYFNFEKIFAESVAPMLAAKELEIKNLKDELYKVQEMNKRVKR